MEFCAGMPQAHVFSPSLPIDYETRFFVAVDPAAGGEKSILLWYHFGVSGNLPVIICHILINCHDVIRIRVKSSSCRKYLVLLP